MCQTAHQVTGGNLLRMLKLLLAQSTLIIHRRHFQQDQTFGKTLRGQRQNVRAPVDHQRDFVIGKPLASLQTFLHQANIQRKIAQEFRKRGAEQFTCALGEQLLRGRVGVMNGQLVIDQQYAVNQRIEDLPSIGQRASCHSAVSWSRCTILVQYSVLEVKSA